LLRANDLDRLHNWANNLDYWFEWMADGPIIHAWQIIAEVRGRPDSDKGRLRDARERLLEAVKRGIPIYTEGLRLLRDGLLLFDRAAEGGDEEVASALRTIGAYTAVADWSATTTSFTGAQPDDPSSESSLGQPESTAECVYVYDVPLDQVIDRGLMAPGEEIYMVVGDTRHTATVRENGFLIYGGRPYTCLGDLHKAVTGSADDAWAMWVVSSTNGRLFDLCQGLRRPA
jgi:hypothetical protein